MEIDLISLEELIGGLVLAHNKESLSKITANGEDGRSSRREQLQFGLSQIPCGNNVLRIDLKLIPQFCYKFLQLKLAPNFLNPGVWFALSMRFDL